jgi:hypothetical protein
MQHFHEALEEVNRAGEVNRAVERYDLVLDTFLVNMGSVGKDTLEVHFARLGNKNRHIWSKAEQVVRTTAKNQRAMQGGNQESPHQTKVCLSG